MKKLQKKFLYLTATVWRRSTFKVERSVVCRERFSTLGISFTVSCFVKAKTEEIACQSLQK